MLNNNSLMDEVMPLEFFLSQNYPNPFKEKTIIKYCVAYKTRVQITVYNSEGKEIEKLVDEEKQAGTYEVKFSASTDRSGKVRYLSSGYYFYRMIAENYSSEKKWLCINNLLRSNTMKSLLHSLFFFLLVTQICFGQWYQQNSGTTKNLSDVEFIDTNNGFAVGDSGIILRTTDAGNNWLILPSETTLPLNDIFFLDELNGWILGGKFYGSGNFVVAETIIRRTIDGGATWYTLMEDSLSAIWRLIFVDTLNGWRVGLGTFRTTDGGVSWSEHVFYLVTIQDVYAKDLNACIVVGYLPGDPKPLPTPKVYSTTNGGNSWYEGNLGFYGIGSISGIYSSGAANVFAVGAFGHPTQFNHGLIAKTTDWGITWSTDTIAGPSFSDVYFIEANNGWIAGVDRIFRTTDGGNNWFLQLNDTLNVFSSIYFADVSNGWVVGNNGTILHTTNGGVSFVEEEQLSEVPTEFLLSNNYPNPFNPSTKIKYSVPQTSQVQIKVFDVLGNEIETLINEEKPSGTYELTWNAANLPSGVYFYQLKAGSFVETKKMILLK